MFEDDEVEVDNEEVVVEDITGDDNLDDYLNEIVTESQPRDVDEDEPEFKKNEEGQYGDEWEEETIDELKEKIKKERNKAAAERRIAEKAKKKNSEKEEGNEDEAEESDEEAEPNEEADFNTKQIEYYREQYEANLKKINGFEPIAKMLYENKIDKNKLNLGIQFVKDWEADPIACAQMLLTTLGKNGIDLDRILDHNTQQIKVNQQVHQQVAPVMQEREAMMRETKLREVANNFLTTYPDAQDHLQEIGQVMERTGNRDPFDAYFRLRSVYKQNGVPWHKVNEEEFEPETQVEKKQIRHPNPASRSLREYDFEEEPTTLDEIIRKQTQQYFRS